MTAEALPTSSVAGEYNAANYLVRLALDPRILDPRTGTPSALRMLSPSDIGGKNKERSWGWSVAFRAMLPGLDEVHKYGCRTAEKANKGKAARFADAGKDFQRPRDTVHYAGAYDIPVSGVADIGSQYYTVSVEPFPTQGLAEHCRIRIDVKDAAAQTEDDLAGDRTEIIWQIFDLLQSFAPYICECDKPDLVELIEGIQRKLLADHVQ